MNPRIATLAVAGAVAIIAPVVAQWEGLSLIPRWDPYGRVMEVCNGNTRIEMRPYTEAECMAILQKELERDAQKVLSCTPGLSEYPFALAAATSLSYNIGFDAYCRSTVAKKFNAGDFRGGCLGFAAWKYAGGKVMQGLVNRRADEIQICLTGLPT